MASKITATSPAAFAREGNFAVSTFTLNTALTSATIVGASLTGSGATEGDDFSGFQVHMGLPAPTVGSDVGWTDVTGGQFTLNAGQSTFYLRTNVLPDTIVEADGSESVTFAVSQLSTSVGLTDSWWVDSTVKLADAVTVVATTITETTTSPQKTVTEGTNPDAVATFKISDSGGLDAPANVDISAIDWGTDSDDFNGNLQYKIDAGSWIPLGANEGTISLDTGTKTLGLKLAVVDDGVTEYGEAVTFVVSQTEANSALKDSWWVDSTIKIVDKVVSSVTPVTINDSTHLTPVYEGHDAVANFKLGGTLGADTIVKISATGWGADETDLGGHLYYHIVDANHLKQTSTDPIDISNGWTQVGLEDGIILTKNATELQLGVKVATDSDTEYGDSVNFVVSQTTAGGAIKDSWWKSGNIDIKDSNSVGGPIVVVDINVLHPNPITPVSEGNDAVATYTFTAPLGTDGADVIISANGWGADETDFVNESLFYRVKTGAGSSFDTTTPVTDWTRVLTGLDGVIHLDQGVNGLQLGVSLEKDGVTEYSEAVNFVVQQTTDSVALKDSWWESTTIKIADTVIQGAFTGGVGPDIFRIPNTSIAQAGKFISIQDFVAADDKIDLGMFDFTGSVSKITKLNETAVLDLISQKSLLTDGFNDNGAMMYKVGSDAYLLVDKDTDNAVDLASDIFVKIVGGGSITTQEIAACLS